MKATDTSRLLRVMLAAMTGLVFAAACLAQAPSVSLGQPIPSADGPVPPQSTSPAPMLPAPPVQPVLAPPGQAGVPPLIAAERPSRVGEILIEGNQWTKEHVIRRQVPLEPGQILSFPELRVAEANLAGLGIFEVNPN